MDCNFIESLTSEQKTELLKLLSDDEKEKPIKKYEFTGETITHDNRTLRQIRRLSDGIVGGYIESEYNLSHEGKCWVYSCTRVWGNARVHDNALVYGSARVFGNAQVYGNALVYGNARIYDDAQIYGNSQVHGEATVTKGFFG